MKTIYNVIAFLFFSSGLLAQLPSDALRFSTFEIGGTARTMGINGAINSLGADFSVLSTNPAGLAAFRRSEFTFSPGVSANLTESTLKGSADNLTFAESDTKFHFSNIGVVFANRPSGGSNWKTANFGLGLNRIADFYTNNFYAGQSVGSITDRWIELADGFTPGELDDFEAGPAYDAGAIYNPFADETLYANDFASDEIVDKAQIVRTDGAINEILFAFAGSYEDKLMVGASLGLPIVSYEETKEYVESDEDDTNDSFKELIYNEYLKTSGTGINLKMGFIYRPIQAFRVGASVHTPTSYSLEDQFDSNITYDFEQGPFESESPSGLFEYRLKTPWRVNGGASFMFGKLGFLSAEVEWVDYSSAAFNFNSNLTNLEDKEYEQLINQQIEDNYTSALNVRLGGELAINILRLRLGYGLLGSPYANDSFSNGRSLSGGIGIRERNFFMDLAYHNTQYGETYVPYIVAGDNKQSVTTDYVRQKFVLTFGFKF
ncbi:MAG: hypothetical protein GYB31_02440 [Bacteroidetes bacterium]|nr:hypothetical protein [Bacteroidota bacterium]